MTQAVELIRFEVAEDRVAQFIGDRAGVDEALTSLAGFLGSELINVSGDQWLLIVRWNSREDALAAQKVTAGMEIISNWIGIANKFVSFDTSDVHYLNRITP
jgi:hypothetical protein